MEAKKISHFIGAATAAFLCLASFSEAANPDKYIGNPTPTPTIPPTTTPAPTSTPAATSTPASSVNPVATATPVSSTTSQKLDLRPSGSSGAINGALFYQTNPQTTGTGSIDPFLQVQERPIEQGYNSSSSLPLNATSSQSFQPSVSVSSLATFTINGVAYYKFMLDSNQSGTSFLQHSVWIGQIQVFTTNNPAPTTTAFNSNGTIAFDSSTHLVYNLNIAGQTNSVDVTAVGSGVGDMYMYIPTSDFIYATDKYVILYFFAGTFLPSSGGFEEWQAFTKTTSSVPDRSSSVVLGSIAFGALLGLRRIFLCSRKRRPLPP